MDKRILNSRLQKVFKRILEPDFTPSSNFSLEKLITHLSENTSDNTPIVELPAVADFAVFSSHCFDDFKQNQIVIKTFILKLVAKVTEREVLFLKLRSENVYKTIFSKFDIISEKNPSIKLSLLDIMESMTKHSSGLDWLITSEKWLHVLKLCQQNQTIYFFRSGTKFIANLIWKTNDIESKSTCEDIVSYLVKPLLENKWSGCTTMDDESDIQMYAAFYPSLTILTETLYNIERVGKTNRVIRHLSNKFNLKWQLCQILRNCRKTDLLVALSKLIYVHWIADASNDSYSYRMGREELVKFALIQCNIMSTILTKRNSEVIIEVTSFAFILLCKIRNHHKMPMSCEKDGRIMDFTNQVIILSLVPMLCSLKLCKSEFVDAYVDKLVATACEHTTRLTYSFRDLIKEKNDPMLIVKAVQSTISYRKYLDKAQAVLIFQSFFYCLHNFIPQDDPLNFIVIGVDTRETVLLVSTMLEAIYVYIEHFGIQWQETVESLCVHSFCARVLRTKNMDPKLTILAFKLSELTIKKYLSPNLALLVNNANGSVIEDLSRNIYQKLHDPNWCIRDSAMELLLVVVGIAENKFTAFQQQIVENELPELIVTLAFDDSETYVRASALKCISIMVRIKVIWENHIKYLQLPVRLMKLLYEESEGLVRKEAVNVVTNLYTGKKFDATVLDDIFLTMFHSAAKDLHWEVQIGALEFWREVILNQMNHQGMIDGVFPSVTFSKENKKIVKLNDMEIKKRLKKILNELALRGCLGALLCCMNDESEIQVMEKSLDVINILSKLFELYHFCEVDSVNDAMVLPKPMFDANGTKSESDFAEIGKYRNTADVRNETIGGEVNITLNSTEDICPDITLSKRTIEYIVNSDDVNLLAHVYSNQLKVNQVETADNYDFAKTNGVKDITNMFIEPKKFMKTIKETDYQKIIDQKYKWSSGISTNIYSLIEDILAVYTPHAEVNSLDCY